MLSIISGLPKHVVGIKATGDVDQKDFEQVLIPALDQTVEENGEINYLLQLETPVKNFSIGAWWEDAKVGLKHFTKWHKIAIVTAEKGVEKFSDIFGIAVPGESKGFPPDQLEEAKLWVAS
jgi:hypothetical protein